MTREQYCDGSVCQDKKYTVGHALARQCAIQIIARMASANQPPVAHSARYCLKQASLRR